MKGLFFNIIGNAGRIRGLTEITPNFRLIELEAESLRSAQFAPGQKIMIRVDRFSARTYTPFAWDNAKGAVSILVYLHRTAPGTNWARSINPGDRCQFIGPKQSLDLAHLRLPAIFFGDETSIALAALHAVPKSAASIRFLFEFSSVSESRQVLDALHINDAITIQREADDAHFPKCEAALSQAVERITPIDLILTGKAQSIRRLRTSARNIGIDPSRLKIRPYWSPGKVGMD